MITNIIAMMAGAMLAADGQTPTVAAPVAPPAAEAKHDPNKTVCRNAAPTGTRLGNRVCHTQQQWDDITAEHQKAIREQQMEHQVQDRQG